MASGPGFGRNEPVGASLGIVNEAQTAAAVLGRMFPESPRYKDALDLLTKAGLEPHKDENSRISCAFQGS